MEISAEKAKILAFQGKEPIIPRKICIANKILKIVKFTYLG
jgi:hypothetical protein